MWIGTKDGLNRYDGTTVLTCHHDPKNNESLPDDNISFIIEDKNKTLWIESSGALCYYDREKDTFIKQLVDGKFLSFQNVISVNEFLYFITPNNLYSYNSSTKKWNYVPFSGDVSTITMNCSIETWNNGNLIIGSRWSGLFTCNTTSGKLERANFIDGKLILDTYKDSKNYLWVSVSGKGVFCFDSSGNKRYEITPQTSHIPCDKVMNISEYQVQ